MRDDVRNGKEIGRFRAYPRPFPVDTGLPCAKLTKAAKWLFLLALLMEMAGERGSSSRRATVGCWGLPSAGVGGPTFDGAGRQVGGDFPRPWRELRPSSPEPHACSARIRRDERFSSTRRLWSEYLLHVAPYWARVTRPIRPPQAAKHEGQR